MITLRVLTRKSKLGFGKYADTPVGVLLNRKQHRYLRSIYYTWEAITFQDDILDEIGVVWKIDKPGCDKSLIEKTNALKEKRRSGHMMSLEEGSPEREKLMHEIVRRRSDKRHNDNRDRGVARRSERLTKGIMQAANHGHMAIGVEEDS